MYVDDLNLIGTPEELTRTTKYSKNEFEMKDLRKTKFCLGLQIEHFPIGVLIHQSAYTKKIFKLFYMDKAHYCTCPDIAFSVNLLAKYSFAPNRRHWNGIKHILRYFQGTTDMGLFYSKKSKQQLFGYADTGYFSNPHKVISQTGYVFNCNGIVIFWRSFKQTMVATSSNHSELIAIHEASRECIWLRSMI